MTPVYPSRTLEFQLSGVWTDLTAYADSNITGSWGIDSNSPNDRVAGVGSLEFRLKNFNKQFTPSTSGTLSGWGKGIAVRLKVTLDGTTVVRWKGFVATILPTSGEWGDQYVTVTCKDWLEYAAKSPITLASIATNKKADEGVLLVLATMAIQPDATNLTSGTETFATIFDTIKTSTRALAEFAKLNMSEYGYLYLLKDPIYGETLRMENRHTRDAGIAYSVIPVATVDSHILASEDGGGLLAEDGTHILTDDVQSYTLDNVMTDLELSYGDDVYNHVGIRNYPRVVSGSPGVLFSQDAPISLAAGETKTDIRGYYTDQFGQRVNGTSMSITSAAMYANSDGTGTNLTANLVYAVTFGTEGLVITSITNSGGTGGYVTAFRASGYPIYTYNAVEQFFEDGASITANGYNELVIDQKYSSSTLPNAAIAQTVLNQQKDPKVKIDKIHFIGNISYELMMAFMFFDVGSLIQIISSADGINSSYFIQGVEFDIDLSGIVRFAWKVKEALTLSAANWVLETVGYSELETTTFVSY